MGSSSPSCFQIYSDVVYRCTIALIGDVDSPSCISPKPIRSDRALASLLPREKVDRLNQALTIKWIQAEFRRYYEQAELTLPDRFTRREFGFMFYDSDLVQRHTGFARASDLKDYLVNRTPAHVYHSAAYYERPGAPTMEEKGWLGADLIFDLDADHIERVKGMPYEQMLEEVKQEIKKIVDQFLLGDFGLSDKSISISFSGGRGYHIHARDPRLWPLGPHERREIVDYITGTDYNPEMTVRKEPYEVTKWGTKYRYAMAPANVAGWRKRLARGMVDAAERLEGMGREKSIEYLCSFKGIDVKIAKVIYETLFRQTKGERGIDKLRDGRIDIFPTDRYLNLFRQTFLQVSLDLGKRETDEPVTSDIKRLIRMVSSLHGKTGLRVVRLTRDQLDDFMPLRDAVPATFRDDPVKMQVGKVANVTLRGETFNLSEGLTEVPEYVAVFLACRGWATIPQV